MQLIAQAVAAALAPRTVDLPFVICAANRPVDGNGCMNGEGGQEEVFRIDWVQLTIQSEKTEKVKTLISEETGKEFVAIPVPRDQKYKLGDLSGQIRVYSGSKFKKARVCIVIPGSANPTEKLRLIADLVSLGGHLTRIDFAFDDLAGLTTFKRTMKSWKKGRAVTRFRTLERRELYDRSGACCGAGLFFGSRTSDTCLRVYRKGSPVFLRWELEVKHKVARGSVQPVFQTTTKGGADGGDMISATSLYQRLHQLAHKLLLSRLSFRRTSESSNVSRAPLERWWECFVNYISPAQKYDMLLRKLEFAPSQTYLQLIANPAVIRASHHEEPIGA